MMTVCSCEQQRVPAVVQGRAVGQLPAAMWPECFCMAGSCVPGCLYSSCNVVVSNHVIVADPLSLPTWHSVRARWDSKGCSARQLVAAVRCCSLTLACQLCTLQLSWCVS